MGKRLIEARAEGMQSARVALSMIAADIRSAIPLPGKVEFLGMRRRSAKWTRTIWIFRREIISRAELASRIIAKSSYFLDARSGIGFVHFDATARRHA